MLHLLSVTPSCTNNKLKQVVCRINIDCDATDICATQEGLYYSYSDFNQDLMPARKCVQKKCPAVWAACEGGNQTK